MPSSGYVDAAAVKTANTWASFDTTAVHEITIAALRFAGAVEFGSRALGVHTDTSNYDFAILRSNFEKLFEHNMPNEAELKHYFKVVPPSGRNSLAGKVWINGTCRVDLLILEHQEHLDMVKRAITSIKFDPATSPWTHVKDNRIRKYEEALLKQGFRTR